MDSEDSDICAGLFVVGVLVLDLLAEPKPLKSGISSATAAPFSALLVFIGVEDAGGGVIGGGVATLLRGLNELAVLDEGVSVFCGLIDLARSVVQMLFTINIPPNKSQSQKLTSSSCRSLLSSFLNFFFQLAISLRVFSLTLFR